jgi:hypothetical protein
VDNNWVARLYGPDSSADVMDPTRILVAENIRQGAVYLCSPDSLNNVQVRPAEPRSTNANNHIVGFLNPRVGKFLKLKKRFSFQSFIKFMKSSRSHCLFPPAAIFWRLPSSDLIYHGLGARQRETRQGHRLPPGKAVAKNIDNGEVGCHGSVKVYPILHYPDPHYK